MFILRCIFWLGLVYASISCTNDAFVSVGPSDALPATAANMVDHALAGLSEICRREPARCLADAARLTALIESGAKGGEEGERRETTPMPVPDPRRHSGRAMQTPAL